MIEELEKKLSELQNEIKEVKQQIEIESLKKLEETYLNKWVKECIGDSTYYTFITDVDSTSLLLGYGINIIKDDSILFVNSTEVDICSTLEIVSEEEILQYANDELVNFIRGK